MFNKLCSSNLVKMEQQWRVGHSESDAVKVPSGFSKNKFATNDEFPSLVVSVHTHMLGMYANGPLDHTGVSLSSAADGDGELRKQHIPQK